MQQLTAEGRRIVDDVAQRHGVSSDAVLTLLMALVSGHGTQAQFNHPDLGGMGQWSQGGMTMVGDMFNNALKYRVDSLCSELSGLLQSTQFLAAPAPAQSQSQSQSGGASGVSLFVPGSFSSGNWWPSDLGAPSSTGAQNNLRYAFFPSTRRLAIDINGSVTVYDTGDHQISGFSQQQSGDQSITFSSQYGLVRVADLPVVGPSESSIKEAPRGTESAAPQVSETTAAAAPDYMPPIEDPAPQPSFEASLAVDPAPADPAPSVADLSVADAAPVSGAAASSSDEIFSKIERLADLRDKGILTEQEFETKKTDLLDRL